MPCYGRIAEALESARIEEEKKEAIENLKKGLAAGTVRVGRSQDGSLSLMGWNQRGQWCDTCAFEHLKGNSILENAKMTGVQQGNQQKQGMR